MFKRLFILMLLIQGCNRSAQSQEVKNEPASTDAKQDTSSVEGYPDKVVTKEDEEQTKEKQDNTKSMGNNTEKKSEKELEIIDTNPGAGAEVSIGDRVYVEYEGKLEDGTVFASNMDGGDQPLSVVVGVGQLIKGWDEGILGMKEGGLRELVIPSRLAYGEKGAGNGVIPAHADLHFKVKLLKVLKKDESGELIIEDDVAGSGEPAQKGDEVTVHYRGKFLNGLEFDASYNRGEPFTITLGENRVIAGWEQGLLGVKEGGKRRLTIPAHLGYGTRGGGSIGPNQMLVFDIEAVKVKKLKQ